MLHLKKVLGAKPKEHVVSELATLYTPWGEGLDPHHVLEEHPTPQFARASFATLNGTWSCAFAPGGHAPTDDLAAICAAASLPATACEQQIVVPFSPEAPLSGIGRQLQPTELMWYRRTFAAPARKTGDRVLLHFQAVDYACAVRVNGELAGTHAGGYTPFAFDITDLLTDDANELAVCVADPSEFGGHLRGKQRFDRGDIWYSAQSGIWQTVWLEVVPATHMTSAVIEPGSFIEPMAVIHTGVRIGAGARVTDSVIMPFAVIEDGAVIDHAILGPRTRVMTGAKVKGTPDAIAVTGENETVKAAG